MKNSGIVVANDASQDRLKAVVGNNHRLGKLLFAFLYTVIACKYCGVKQINDASTFENERH